MTNFWDNIRRFPSFLLSVITGFFLTTFYPIFELLKVKNKRLIIVTIILIFIMIILNILRYMLSIN
uniref:Uncharacterized protein ycf33 n=2 Tax=Gracilariopsis TaxID=2781 RepID=A0A1C9CF94_9FLOR|nr:Ycf33 [Gracilariopsis lemaneiformis]YP_009294762.1 hypothetical protein Gch_163 [Gracilariopsis chorda]AJO68403.1 hypothetical protein [Gracilariopsis lemaneiformis]AML79947.1 Ycf33 [Gracilariopsis lemaneiformis]AOM67022.1 hypothetical protein Gch_163 [Gracilariopsis chorda]